MTRFFLCLCLITFVMLPAVSYAENTEGQTDKPAPVDTVESEPLAPPVMEDEQVEEHTPSDDEQIVEQIDPPTTEETDHETIEADTVETETQTEEIVEEQTAKELEDVKPSDVAAIESFGTLTSVKNGALGKSLWKDQKRSDIVHFLTTLPVRNNLFTLQKLKLNLLTSESDSALLINDVPPKAGQDLFTLRLIKLMEIGAYNDAYAMYTQKIEDPYHENLARMGILLTMFQGDLATACLDEKVLAARYPQSKFWALLDAACNVRLGKADKNPADIFDKSPYLKAVYDTQTFRVSAADEATMMGMSYLERGIVFNEGRIDYAGLLEKPATLASLDTSLIALYEKDPNLPEGLIIPVRKELFHRAIKPSVSVKDITPLYQSIDIMETDDEKWEALKNLLSTEENLAFLSPFTVLLEPLKPATIDTKTAMKWFVLCLYSDTPVPPYLLEALQQKTEENPRIPAYLEVARVIFSLNTLEKTELDKFQSILGTLAHDRAEKIQALYDIYGRVPERTADAKGSYEKKYPLTEDEDYVMPIPRLVERIEQEAKNKNTGLTVLTTLHAFPRPVAVTDAAIIFSTLEGIQSVGLYEDARRISSEILATIILEEEKGE